MAENKSSDSDNSTQSPERWISKSDVKFNQFVKEANKIKELVNFCIEVVQNYPRVKFCKEHDQEFEVAANKLLKVTKMNRKSWKDTISFAQKIMDDLMGKFL